MARTLEDLIAELPKARREKIERKAKVAIAEVRSLGAIRKLAGLSQAQLAQTLGVAQPTVNKMEKQADFYVSTLERFVTAAGGTVEIVVNLPGHQPVKVHRFSDLAVE